MRFFGACWSLVALICSNGYKSIFKSNYVFEPNYTRNWTTLLDMNNFTVYFASTQPVEIHPMYNYPHGHPAFISMLG